MIDRQQPVSTPEGQSASIMQVFLIFLRLGCYSFGGPAAHLGYFRKSFVDRRRWLSDQEYGALVALSQFLPGPGSSQVGFALGMKQSGIAGGIAAFLGFTLPSFLLMVWLAVTTSTLNDQQILSGLTHGLKLLALVVVADACLGMMRSFCQQALTRWIAVCTFTVLLTAPMFLVLEPMTGLIQIGLLLLAAIIGWLGLKPDEPNRGDTAQLVKNGSRWLSLWLVLGGMALLLIAAFILIPAGDPSSLDTVFLTFFQAGSLVFGGGHVVLPLLEDLMATQMTPDRFLTGYSLAQAVPGPMFTLASFLGAEIGWQAAQSSGSALLIAMVATTGIFLPGLLLMAVLLPHWQVISSRPAVMAPVKGLNAAVVGFLFQALAVMLTLTLVQPYSTGVSSNLLTELLPDLLLLAAGWFALKRLNVPIVWLVIGFAAIGYLRLLLC